VTNTFQVIVNEVNLAPVLTVPADQTINEQTSLSVNATATDADLPANTLTLALASWTPGTTLNPMTGAASWTPTEAQGPSTNIVSVSSSPTRRSSDLVTNTFQVIVNEVNLAPVLTVPADQTINEQTSLSVNATATDADLPANSLTFALVSSPAGMTINPASGAISWTPTEAQGPSTNSVSVSVTHNGVPALRVTITLPVAVQVVNLAPVLTVPADQTMTEQTTLSVSASAIDADMPANTLTFALVSAPTGMTINPASGAISWTPTEAQGPSTNAVSVSVTDNGVPALSVTNTFTVTVNEIGRAPCRAGPGDQAINEQTTMSVSASATDADLPANSLTFALVSSPAGMTINPASGAISWTSTEAQGPSTNIVSVSVTDNGVPALSVTNTFTVTVNEVNLAPVLTVPADQTINEQTSLSVNATATDADLPANSLTFALVSSPAGMTINPASGAISWTPTEAQGPSTNIDRKSVEEDEGQALSVTKTVTVIGNEVTTAPVPPEPAHQTTN